MRLLILMCSSRKRGGEQLIPAVYRYDGPLWRVLRKFIRTKPDMAKEVKVFAISAVFGLIPIEEPIPLYDQAITKNRLGELREEVLDKIKEVVQWNSDQGSRYTSICLSLSKNYMKALQGWDLLVPVGVKVTILDGTMGKKLKHLRNWLEEREDEPESHRLSVESPHLSNLKGKAKIAGHCITMKREEILELAREALQSSPSIAKRSRQWYVSIGDEKVSPKWLISLITGIPTSKFDASAARRVLKTLGIEVHRF